MIKCKSTKGNNKINSVLEKTPKLHRLHGPRRSLSCLPACVEGHLSTPTVITEEVLRGKAGTLDEVKGIREELSEIKVLLASLASSLEKIANKN